MKPPNLVPLLKQKIFRWKLILAGCLLLALLAYTGVWLKSPYSFTQANQVAEKFIAHLQNGDSKLAFEMTFKNGLVGKTLPDFKKYASRQLCSIEKLERVYYYPLQTNGNRLRRWLRGNEVEMPEIGIEFENYGCLFSVALRPTKEGQWKVYNFQSHAG